MIAYILSLAMCMYATEACDKAINDPVRKTFGDFRISVSDPEISLVQEKAEDDALTISWDGSFDEASSSFLLEIGAETEEGTIWNWSEIMSGNERSRTFPHKELNSIIIDKYRTLQSDRAKLKVRLTASTSIHWKLYSESDSTFVECTTYEPVYPEHNFKAPLYWSPYEYNFLTNHYIPESEWKNNIDWVAENLKTYGFTMVSTDGWMDETNAFNEYGYLDRHSLNWEHDYGWWADYLESKGMQLGVYCNPLWVPSGAASAGIKIKGTDIPIENIINRNEENGGRHSYLWVQLDRPGAEEWVRGYVDHFGEMGVKFLRVDFLSWYEDGYDIGYGTVGPDRPDWMYRTALRWMREECDKYGMILSLVMPHLYNDAATEKNYGHMIRICNDTAEGGWWHFSDVERGVHRNGWSQYSNAFDGFIYFSRVSGRGKVMLDGDFIRLNTMASEDECRSVITLNVVAGGPVTIADTYNSIGDRLEFYQNREILALVEDGFVGKPLSDNPPHNYEESMATGDKTSIWTGDMSDGDKIVAFFNRPWSGTSSKTITFRPEDYGMSGDCTVRDLWNHTTLPTASSYSIEIPYNGCVIYRLSKK